MFQISIVGVVNDALYSDSPQVVDSLADLMEALLVPTPERVSEDRMNQVRHIIQVDEESFRARFSPEQLSTIEQKEIESLVDELISAVGLQRFRFVERQKSGMIFEVRHLYVATRLRLTRHISQVTTMCVAIWRGYRRRSAELAYRESFDLNLVSWTCCKKQLVIHR